MAARMQYYNSVLLICKSAYIGCKGENKAMTKAWESSGSSGGGSRRTHFRIASTFTTAALMTRRRDGRARASASTGSSTTQIARTFFCGALRIDSVFLRILIPAGEAEIVGGRENDGGPVASLVIHDRTRDGAGSAR